ncbi:MAG: thioredoxin fold domain-containing protein [Candidatus Delongbacteria bacterium]|nr:thioredoxin fold domain-containing protein [Candidatus Delongbacteria bacterium]
MIKYIMILLVTLFAVAFSQEKSVVNKDSIKTPIVTLVEIGSVKCIPCKKMQPILKEIEDEFGDRVEVIFHDIWTTKGKIDAREYNVRLIPTQVFLDSTGKEYFRHEGFFPKKNILKKLAEKGLEN